MFKLDESIIVDTIGNYNSYSKGENYYLNDRVRELVYIPELNLVKALVKGNKNYYVEVVFDEKGFFEGASCTCPAYENYFGYCKHIVAALFEIMDRDREGEFDLSKNSDEIEWIVDYFRNLKASVKKTPLELEVTYEFIPNGYKIKNASHLSFKIGEKKLYKVRNIKKFLKSIDTKEELYFGKQFTLDFNKYEFKKEDQPIIELLMEIYGNEKALDDLSYWDTGASLLAGNKAILNQYTLKRFFEIMKDRKFNMVVFGKEFPDVSIVNEDMPIEYILGKEDDDLTLKIGVLSDQIIPLTVDGEYFFAKNKIYKNSETQMKIFVPFYNTAIRNQNYTIKIPKEYSESFVSEIIPRLEKSGDVHIDEKVRTCIYKPELRKEVYFDRAGDDITAEIKFVYGEISINPFSKDEYKPLDDEKILVRDIEMERELIDIFERADFKVKNNYVYLNGEEKIYDFIYDTMPKLQKLADIYYSEAFKDMKIRDVSSFSGGVRLNTENDLLEFSFEIEGIDRSELADVFNSLKEKKRFYKLKDGSFLPLDIKELHGILKLVEGLDLDKKDFEKEVVQIPKFRAAYIDENLKDIGLRNVERNLPFKQLVQNIKEPNDIKYKIPDNLDKILRKYQKFGFKWLKILSAYGFGGILADDMGLGKTLQVLTFLLSEKEEKGSYPSLIVAPTSLVYNWISEVEKFTPELKTIAISGNKKERENYIANIKDYDVVVTSYPLIRRDIDFYKDISFRYCILDEAQHIKNPASQNAKSVKLINAKGYFALTGTPIENSLTELWSIFDFVMPGYLLSHTKFKKKFEKPIVKDKDKSVLNELSKYIKPFILRRLKKDVLKELPEKIEHKVVAELTKEQKKIYLAYLNQIKSEIDEEIKSKGFEKSHIKILAGLTRLRQICCHPSMFVENFKGESGKLLLLEEIIDESIESGHRILLFSQFTSMLKIIREMLEKKDIEYKYLDGSVATKERGKLVKSFNEGEGKIFLISLKAGGTGLNLTGADTVIHFDPWWNPAVEEQATDRAYRIGQEKSVHVMKLITRGTIEEKIFKLQEKKKEIINAVIKPGETLVTKLTEDEIKELFEF
ncbi:SNF2 helicase associated domain-containing protein [Crassaminicella indica]|uniref:SNF2 helicase associated domain-containing protein n=1 Tax=Crassaminicella indica TaxID=2855394 RepID=A0ABX8RD21_9CLOT|nr:SNF2 helicase associated domain-containing protein [Crassaminicella indica]QXM06661.1 SNF2 helicase associated domain-containing protein [Crassaminicella indica]